MQHAILTEFKDVSNMIVPIDNNKKIFEKNPKLFHDKNNQ